ncbi:MAG: tetratricopeptide repeat protein [Lysobacterales bacterium]
MKRRRWALSRCRAWRGLALGLLLCACQPAEPPAIDVAPPPDLAQLDLAVREQFRQLWEADTRDWGALAQWFHVYRYPDSAERCYREAILQQPLEPRWPYLLALLLVEKSDPSAAEYLEAALALAPEAPQIRLQLADMARRQGQAEQAAEGYRAVLAARPKDAAARFGMGQLALQRGDAPAALEWLLPLAEEQPNAAELNYALGTAWRLQGDATRAAAALERVPDSNLHQLPLQRDDPWQAAMQQMDRGSRMLTRRGIRASREGDHARAARLFGAAVQSDPDGVEERLNWALALSQLGRHEAALAQIDAALNRSVADSDMQLRVRTEQARLLTLAGQPTQAERLLQALLDDHPEQLRARLELARLLHTRGDMSGALAQYAQLRAAGAASPELVFWQAAALLALPDRAAAAEQLRRDLHDDPERQRLQLLQWRLLATDPRADRQSLNSARDQTLALTPSPNVLQVETLAMLLAGSGDHERAARWQQAVVSALEQAAPAQAALVESLHIARRRLTLYREARRPLKAWEPTERPLALRIQVPGGG